MEDLLEGGNGMIKLKGILQGVIKLEEYDGSEAKRYYDRMTKVQWKDKSLEFYEESLNREEFVAHNTVLTIFTDMDKNTEEQITKTTKKKGEKDMKSSEFHGEINERAERNYRLSLTKKELQKLVTDENLTYKIRDTKEQLINILEKKENNKTKRTKEIGIQVAEKVVKEKVVEIPELVNQIIEIAKVDELVESVCLLSKKVKADGKGGTLVNKLSKILDSEFKVWIIKNTVLAEEQNRKYENIKKIKSTKKGTSGKISEDHDAKKITKKKKSKEEISKVLEDLKGKKLTEDIINSLEWRTLKKLAKERGVKSFGKSKSYIMKGLLKNKKTKKK